MSSSTSLDQATSSNSASSSSVSNSNANLTANGSSNSSFKPIRSAHTSQQDMETFEHQLHMLSLKQAPHTQLLQQQQNAPPSSITGTQYTGPPAKYMNMSGGGQNPTLYNPQSLAGFTAGPRMLPPHVTANKYVGYNGTLNNNNSNSVVSNGNGGQSSYSQQQSQQSQQARRPNGSNVDNATNDLVNARKVFVGGLNPETKQEDLVEYFTKFGTVENAAVKYDKSGRSKGYGFVLFEERESTDKVYAQEHHVIQGKRVDPKSAHRRDQALARKVFVGGLDTEVTDDELNQYFSKFGKIAQIEAPVDKVKQKRRPFCFILFENETSAEEVLQQPRHAINGKSVDCKRANPKNTENQNNGMNNNTGGPQPPLPQYGMGGMSQSLFQYQQQQRPQQSSQISYPQAAAALAAQQQHYGRPYYNTAQQQQPPQQTGQQGPGHSQTNRQQQWSQLSPAQWPGSSYDPRTYGTYGPSATANTNAAWQVQAPQGNSAYGTQAGRAPSAGPAGNTNNNAANGPQTQSGYGAASSANSGATAGYSYAGWNFGQGTQAPPSAGPAQYSQYGDSSSVVPSVAGGFAYGAPPQATYAHQADFSHWVAPSTAT